MPIDWAKPVVKQEREESKPRYVDQKACIPKKMGVEESNRKVASREGVEDGDFAVEPDWYLVGGSVVTGISRAKGKKLVDNEIVHFSFPSENMSYRFNANWIVRFLWEGNRVALIFRYSLWHYGWNDYSTIAVWNRDSKRSLC